MAVEAAAKGKGVASLAYPVVVRVVGNAYGSATDSFALHSCALKNTVDGRTVTTCCRSRLLVVSTPQLHNDEGMTLTSC
jgi:hypothetical protein